MNSEAVKKKKSKHFHADHYSESLKTNLFLHIFSQTKLLRQASRSSVVLFQCLKVGDTRSLLTLGCVGNRREQYKRTWNYLIVPPKLLYCSFGVLVLAWLEFYLLYGHSVPEKMSSLKTLEGRMFVLVFLNSYGSDSKISASVHGYK